MNPDNNNDELGFYRYMPVSKKLALEPFLIEGKIWPNQKYYESVAKLSEHIGEKLYIFTVSELGLAPHHNTLEGVVRLDEKGIYAGGEQILLPHTLILDEGNMVNLSRITHISTQYGMIGSNEDFLKFLFGGKPLDATGMAGNMLNESDPYIIYRNPENIEEAFERFKGVMRAVQNFEEGLE